MFINHGRKLNYECIHILGTILSFDEMMIRFCGESVETHHMKNKSINEGYKLSVLAPKYGYIVNFTLDGQTVEKKDEQENTTGRDTEKHIKRYKHIH